MIKNVDEKSIKGIAKEIYEFSNIVRTGKLRSEHIEGGTFTVNNTGSFGSVQSMGIINYPQAAILQVETIVKRPVIMNGGYVCCTRYGKFMFIIRSSSFRWTYLW